MISFSVADGYGVRTTSANLRLGTESKRRRRELFLVSQFSP